MLIRVAHWPTMISEKIANSAAEVKTARDFVNEMEKTEYTILKDIALGVRCKRNVRFF